MEPAQYGNVVLTPNEHGATSTFPQGWASLLATVAGQSIARCLRVRMTVPTDSAPDFNGMLCGDVSGRANGAFITSHDDYGSLRIQLGGRFQRTLYADLQSGDYFIPPAENVTLSVARWNPAGGPGNGINVQVEAELGPAFAGGVNDFRPFTCTGYGYLVATETTSMRIPVGAYALDVQTERGGGLGGLTDWTYNGSDGPIFEAVGGNVYLLRDYQAQVELPGGVIALSGSYQAGASSSYWGNLAITNLAAAGKHVCKAIFYVR